MSRETSVLLVGVLIIVASVASAGVVMAMDDSGTSDQTVDAPGETNRTITVGAAGEATAQPDTATVRISVEATHQNVTQARDAVADNISSVREALTDLGIADDQIRTTSYNIYEDRRHERTSKVDEPIYRARHVLSIDVNEIDMVGSTIDAAVEAGATSVRDVRFGLTDATRNELKQDALTSAMQNARTQADSVAGSESMNVGSVITVQTSDVRSPTPVYTMEAAGMDASAGTDLRSGPVTVTATVQVTYDATAQS